MAKAKLKYSIRDELKRCGLRRSLANLKSFNFVTDFFRIGQIQPQIYIKMCGKILFVKIVQHTTIFLIALYSTSSFFARLPSTRIMCHCWPFSIVFQILKTGLSLYIAQSLMMLKAETRVAFQRRLFFFLINKK